MLLTCVSFLVPNSLRINPNVVKHLESSLLSEINPVGTVDDILWVVKTYCAAVDTNQSTSLKLAHHNQRLMKNHVGDDIVQSDLFADHPIALGRFEPSVVSQYIVTGDRRNRESQCLN